MKVVVWLEPGDMNDEGQEMWVASVYEAGATAASDNVKFTSWQEARAYADEVGPTYSETLKDTVRFTDEA